MEGERKASSFSSNLAGLQPIQTETRNPDDEVEETISSDEEDHHDVDGPADDEYSIVGISIGEAQTRLKSPLTPAAEKAAILNDSADHGFFSFEDVLQITHEEDPYVSAQGSQVSGTITKPQKPSSPVELPSPWRAGPRDFEGVDRLSNHASGSRPEKTRARSSTSPFSFYSATTESERKSSSIFSLPSLPKLPSLFQNVDETAKQSASSFDSNASKRLVEQRRAKAQLEESQFYEEPEPIIAYRTSSEHGSQYPKLLRRTTSDGSLYLQRTLSKASSLGDDARWANVHGQVNSRMKAIKDSWADSNLRLPMKLPSFSVPQPLLKRLSLTGGSSSYHGTLPTVQKLMGSHARSLGSIDRGIDSTEKVPTPPPGMTKASAAEHPHFTHALKHLKGDVVILGGYRGSVLRYAEPPHRQCWVPVKVGLNIRRVNLEVGLDDEDEENMEETIIPSGMLKNIGPVEISRRLFKRLRTSENAENGTLRVWDFGYDWRLSPHLLSRKLIRFLEGLRCNSKSANNGQRGATVIAHSLGGLITRHAINHRPELFSSVVYAGVPQSCVNILGPIRNGDDVLLSSKVLTAQVNFTIRTSFALLPLDGRCFFNRDTQECFDIDFFDPHNWEEFRFSPCISRPLPASSHAQPSGVVDTMMGSLASVLPNALSRRRNSSPRTTTHRSSSRPITPPAHSSDASTADITNHTGAPHGAAGAPARMDNLAPPSSANSDPTTNLSTAVTIPKAAAWAYLCRTLAATKRFKEELAPVPAHVASGAYPPAALIYGKSVPTVYGAHVESREAIKRADAYSSLAFASGDGVVLARAAQLPEGYQVVRGGVVSSDRGHISLLGDLEAVGRCLNAVAAERRRRGGSREGSGGGGSLQGSVGSSQQGSVGSGQHGSVGGSLKGNTGGGTS